MKFRPGINAIRLAGGVIGIAVMSMIWPVVWPLVFAAMLILSSAMLYEAIQLRQQIQRVEVQLHLPERVGRGHQFLIRLTLQRTFSTPLQASLRVQAPIDCFPQQIEKTWQWTNRDRFDIEQRLKINIRGRHQVGPAWLRLTGRWQLLECQRQDELIKSVKVFPETYFTGEKLLQDAASQMEMLDKISRDRLRGAGTEYESLKEFREGDDPRRIDWRTSARHKRLVVRRYQIERHRDVMIVIDAGRLMAASYRQMTKLDAAIDAGLVLTRVALEGGDRCGLGLFDHEVLGYAPPRAGKGSLTGIQDRIYDIQSRWTESDFSLMFATLQQKQPKRSLMIIISDLLDETTTDRFRSALVQLSQRHVVLFAALKTPLLHEVVNQLPENMVDGWKNVLSYRLLHQREQALFSLRHAGVHVLDVLPEQIGPKLVNEFIALRSRNLL